MNSEVKSKAPVKNHITADAPGETFVLDLMYFPEAHGDKYILVAVDAYSRWVEVMALANRQAKTVMDATIDLLFTSTAGGVKEIITDQGSEFKAEFAQAMELLKVEHKYTAAHRSEGHGMVERFNRTLTKSMKGMISTGQPGWQRALRWAKLANNNSVHRSLSMMGDGLTPAEVHLGRRLNLHCETALNSAAAVGGKKEPQEYVKDLEKQVQITREWIKQARTLYNKSMQDYINKRGRKHREFAVGELVRLKKITHGLKRKTQTNGRVHTWCRRRWTGTNTPYRR